MRSRFIGGILLVVGTSIGGGMLALPLACAAAGFWPSTLLLLACWALMTLGALYILEANLYLPRGAHMVSMAAATLGRPGLLLTWASYLILLYTLLCAYISGGSDVFGGLFERMGWESAPWQRTSAFTLAFGAVVWGGIRRVDWFNRVLMFAKLGICALLVVMIAPHVDTTALAGGSLFAGLGALMVLLTSFGFAIIVPNLRDYFEDDITALRRVILIGSLIPLLCYLAWNAVIMGSITPDALVPLMQSERATSTLAQLLATRVQSPIIIAAFNVFTSICMLTAFLGVSLCLFSFLGDGLRMGGRGREGRMLFLLTFLPPMLVVLWFPGAWMHALSFAGALCVILLLLLPALMCLQGRRHFQGAYTVPGGSVVLWLVIVSGLGLLGFALATL